MHQMVQLLLLIIFQSGLRLEVLKKKKKEKESIYVAEFLADVLFVIAA